MEKLEATAQIRLKAVVHSRATSAFAAKFSTQHQPHNVHDNQHAIGLLARFADDKHLVVKDGRNGLSGQ